jgi:hypothetical protein
MVFPELDFGFFVSSNKNKVQKIVSQHDVNEVITAPSDFAKTRLEMNPTSYS